MTELTINIKVKNGVAETKVSCSGVYIISSVDSDSNEGAMLKAISASGGHALDVIETIDDMD